MRVAVLGSTRGTDLQALLDAQAAHNLGNAEIVLVASNKAEAGILDKARVAGIEAVYIEGANREDFEQQLSAILQRRKIDLIVLIGFMRILSDEFVKHYDHKILNIHPSLLPKYAGGMNTDVHAAVLKNHETVTGCTLHYVTEQVDGGPIYSQEEVPVLPDDTPNTLRVRVQAAEQKLLVRAIRELS